MFNLKGTLSSCLTVVAFLVLAILATQFYNGTNTKTDFEESTMYQKSQTVLNTVWSYAKIIVNVNLIKNVGVGNANLEENIKNELNNKDLGFNDYNNGLDSSEKTDLKNIISSIISWRKTAKGGELIITSKSGREYKLSLPFKFLAK